MVQSSSIEWCTATWNPTRGCRRVAPECEKCYAEDIAVRFDGPGLAYEGLTTNGRWNGAVRVLPDKMDEPLRIKEPQVIFVDSMSDLFYEGSTFGTIDQVFGVMALAWWHTFIILTKRPARMRQYLANVEKRAGDPFHDDTNAGIDRRAGEVLFSLLNLFDGGPTQRTIEKARAKRPTPIAWPLPNVWLGTSAGSQPTADKFIPELLACPAAIRLVSIEPLIAPTNLSRIRANGAAWSLMDTENRRSGQTLDWIIVGGESGPGARPCNVEWVRSIVAQCKAAAVPVFLKQLGARPEPGVADYGCSPHSIESHWPEGVTIAGDRIFLRDKKGGDIEEFPMDLRIREFPRVVAR
jgi:protein gp37